MNRSRAVWSKRSIISTWRRLSGLALVAGALAVTACNDDTGATRPLAPGGALGNTEEAVPNLDPSLQGQLARMAPTALRSLTPGAPSLALASAAVSSACSRILIYDNNTARTNARNAVTAMGLSFTRAVSGDFNTLLTGQTWDLVIMDNPSTEPTAGWQANLSSYVAAGGRLIHTHWNPSSLTPLLGTLEIANPVNHGTPRTFHQWNGHSLFTTPNAVPSSLSGVDFMWASNGFAVNPTGTAIAAAGFNEAPLAGEAAIVIGNDGRTIFNGFLFDDYDAANTDDDGLPDIDELIQNEVEHVCGGGKTIQEVPANTAATVTVTENGDAVAGIQISADTFDEDVTVTVEFVPVTATSPCHNYLLGQIGRCLTVTAKNDAGEDVQLQAPAIVGLCLPEHLHLEIFKFSDPNDRPIPLPQAPTPFLDCEEFQSNNKLPSSRLEGLAMGVMKRVGKWLSPKPLYAADRGFGGVVGLFDDHLSTFSWASPIQVTRASLAVNVLGRGKDVFGVRGTFGLEAKNFAPALGEAGFDPARDAVTVGYGSHVLVIPAGSFRFFPRLGRYIYAAIGATTGITAMEITPTTGAFTIAGIVPTQGSGSPTFRPFTLQIGNRVRGAGLTCGEGTSFECQLEHSTP